MPSYSQHLSKAQSNLDFIKFITTNSKSFCDWVITAYFYAALHLIEAYFDFSIRTHYRKHGDRSKAIARDQKLSPIYNDYRKLQTYSQTARYGSKVFDTNYVQNRAVLHFNKLRSSIEGLNPSLRIS